MARMYPSRFPYLKEPSRRAEHSFYKACEKQLGDDWIVLYEQQWHGHRNGKSQSGEADFVMINATFGLFVIEVKGGEQIEIEDGEWFSVPHGQKERVSIKNPFSQVADSKFVLWPFIRDCVPQVRLNGELGHLVVFPGHRQHGDISPQGRRQLICDRDDMNKLEATMKRVAGHFNQKTIWSEETINLVVKALMPTFRILGTSSGVIDETLDDLNRLTDEQLRGFAMLKNLKSMKVFGTAGTGKTVLAYHRAKELALSASNTLYLCSSIPLANFLRKEIEIEFGRQIDNLVINSLEEFFDPITQKVLVAQENNLNTASFEDVLEYLLSQSKEEIELFDALVVDEAQTMALHNLELVALFLKPRANRYVFGDSVQIQPGDSDQWSDRPLTNWLYERKSWSSSFGIAGDCPEIVLTINCRSSKRIAQFANSFTSNEIEIVGPKGVKVKKHVSRAESWSQMVALTVNEWTQEFGSDVSQIRLLVDDDSLLGFLCFNVERLEGVMSFASTEGLPIGVAQHEGFLIDWIPQMALHRQLGFVALALRFQKFFDEKDPGRKLKTIDERKLLVDSSFKVWWKLKEREAESEKNEDAESVLIDYSWPLTLPQAKLFLRRDEILESYQLPILRATRARDFSGLEADAVIVVIPPWKKNPEFVWSLYSMLTRARVLLAVVSDQTSTIQMSNSNQSIFEKTRLNLSLATGDLSATTTQDLADLIRGSLGHSKTTKQ